LRDFFYRIELFIVVNEWILGNLARNDIRDCAANDCYFGDDLQN